MHRFDPNKIAKAILRAADSAPAGVDVETAMVTIAARLGFEITAGPGPTTAIAVNIGMSKAYLAAELQAERERLARGQPYTQEFVDAARVRREHRCAREFARGWLLRNSDAREERDFDAAGAVLLEMLALRRG